MPTKHKKIWEETHGKKLPDGMEIHHIDKNNKNNDPSNLIAVTIEEHLEIHKNQGDNGAVQAILMRMERTPEAVEMLKKAASEHQKMKLREGKHNFQKMTKERRSEISKKAALKTVLEKTGIHAINADPILCKENARKGGLKSAEKCSGFLNTNSENHGSKHVIGTYWWTSSTGERVRSRECPGENWRRGMTYE